MTRLFRYIRFIFILIFIILIYIYLPRIQFDNSLKRWVPAKSDEILAYQDFLDEFGGDAYIIISFNNQNNLDQIEIKKRLDIFQQKVRTFHSVEKVFKWPALFFRLKKHTDKKNITFIVTFSPPSHLNPNRPELLQKIETLLKDIPLESHVAGTGVIYKAINEQTKKSTISFLSIGLLLLSVLLLVILKKPIAFLLSIGISLGGVFTLLLCSAILNIPMSIVAVVLPVLILFYGTSISLHILFHHGDFKKVLIPLLLATGTTCIGFMVFLTGSIPLLRDFAVLAIAGIIGELVWAFIFFFPKVYFFQPRKRLLIIFQKVPIPSKLPILLIIVISLVAMTPGIIKLKSEIYSISVLSTTNKAVLDHYFIEKNVGNYFPLEYIIDNSRVKPEEVENWISSVFKLKEIGGVLSYLSFPPFVNPREYGYISKNDDNLVRVTFLVPLLSTTKGIALVKKINALAIADFDNYTPVITGYVTLYAVIADKLNKSFQQSLILAFLLVFAIIFVYLRNIKLFLASLFPNIFPILFIIGLMGWLKIPLDMVTVPIGCLLLSIIVDDTIHFIYWYKNTGNLRSTFIEAGPGIFHTTIVLILGFSVFLISSSPPIKYFGIISITALLTALIGDFILLPIILKHIEKRDNNSSS
ncbi:MAG: MMPL family transporter [Bacteroidales bacterium]|nr:MMPL family transporter [Bacteroidales bacterium]